jgi:ABC-type multidrug transport system ATPase subunit
MSLVIKSVSKTYDNGVKALQNVSLDIPKGMFGLLGPNGAGKSSLMRTIATLQDADRGSINFNNEDVLENKENLRSKLGYLPQEFGVYPKISAEDLLDYIACLKGINDKKVRKDMVSNLLGLTNLTDAKSRSVSSFSGGMKQRFGIAQALIGSPELIIVDEPTAGLDPAERLRFYNILSEIGEGTTVILSTHIVGDVSDLCPNFAIINNGQVLTQSNPANAIESIKGKIWSKIVNKSEVESITKDYKLLSTKFKMGNILVKVFSDTCPDETFSCDNAVLEDFYFSHIKGYLK